METAKICSNFHRQNSTSNLDRAGNLATARCFETHQVSRSLPTRPREQMVTLPPRIWVVT